MVEVKQVDREAAASLVDWLRQATLEWENIEPFLVADFADAARKGVWDRHPFVQAFAAHREAAEQGKAELVEALETAADSLHYAAERLNANGFDIEAAELLDAEHASRQALKKARQS